MVMIGASLSGASISQGSDRERSNTPRSVAAVMCMLYLKYIKCLPEVGVSCKQQIQRYDDEEHGSSISGKQLPC